MIFAGDEVPTQQVKELLHYCHQFYSIRTIWNCFERRDDLTHNNQLCDIYLLIQLNIAFPHSMQLFYHTNNFITGGIPAACNRNQRQNHPSMNLAANIAYQDMKAELKIFGQKKSKTNQT